MKKFNNLGAWAEAQSSAVSHIFKNKTDFGISNIFKF